jgi:abhydrolase domain-containing protein 12
VIPSAQSEILFDSLLEPNGTAFTGKIETREYPGWGVIKQVELPGGPLVWWEGEHGGHENIGHAEGTMDLLGTLAKL